MAYFIDCDTIKLSQLQKAILLDLINGKHASAQEHARRGAWDAADRSAFSRSVRRLEMRGLIIRMSGGSRKVERLALTPAGRDLARDLQELHARLERIQRGERIDPFTGEPAPDPYAALRARATRLDSKTFRAYSRLFQKVVFRETGLCFRVDLDRLGQVISSWQRDSRPKRHAAPS
jgi:DNA-binding MarR family transcriptional regulator